MAHGLTRLRTLLGVAVCAMWALAGWSATASADSLEPMTSFEIESDVHFFQQGPMDQTKITSYNGYQYISWWQAADAEGEVALAVTRRRLSDDRFETIRFDTPEGRVRDPGDTHNTSVVGVSKIDGRLHVSWVEHNEPMNYAISNSRCLSKTSFSECTFTWRLPTGDWTERRATYPMFFNDVSGNLYLVWRDGQANDGGLDLSTYNNDGTWTLQGTIINGHTGSFDPDGAWTDTDRDSVADRNEPGFRGTANRRGVYIDGIVFDPNDRLHISWGFCEDAVAIGGVAWGIHDLNYIYSEDHGSTWRNDAGRQVGRTTSFRRGEAAEREPVTIEDQSDVLVASIPVGQWRSNFGRLVLDWDWQPHVVIQHSETNSDIPWERGMRYRHYWRTKDAAWHSGWIEPVEAADSTIANGSLVFDRGNNAYFIGIKNELGWAPLESFRTGYNQALPISNMNWQQGRYLHIEPYSEITVIDTTEEEVGVPIGTRSTENSVIEISMRNNSDTSSFRYNFLTNNLIEWREWESARRAEFSVANDNRWHTVRTMVGTSAWRGTLRALEIEMLGVASGEIDIDYIHIQNGSGTVAKRWEFDKGAKLIGAEGATVDGYETWTTSDLLPDEAIGNVSMIFEDSAFNVDYARYERENVLDFTTVRQGAPGVERLHVEELDILEDDPYVKLWEWGVSGDEIGWTALRDVSGLTQATDSGTRVLSGTITGTDSQISSGEGNLHAELGGADTVRIRMKNERATGQEGRICWTANGGTTFRTEQCQTFRITADNTYRVYELSTERWAGWSGELSSVRIEPSEGGTIRSGRFHLDYIRILDNRP